MKYIVVPAPIMLVNPVNKKAFQEQDEKGNLTELEPITMFSFLMRYVVNEQTPTKDSHGNASVESKIGKGFEGSRRAHKLHDLFENAKPSAIVGVEDGDYTVVKKIIEDRIWPLPMMGAQLFSMQEAWMKGENQDAEWFAKQPQNQNQRPATPTTPSA